MTKFHDDLMEVMQRNGFDMLDNLGRRNILMSAAQEKFFAEALARRFNVTCDGKTGEPDIVIHTLDRELECKLLTLVHIRCISIVFNVHLQLIDTNRTTRQTTAYIRITIF